MAENRPFIVFFWFLVISGLALAQGSPTSHRRSPVPKRLSSRRRTSSRAQGLKAPCIFPARSSTTTAAR